MTGVTISSEEIARFDALAARWWDPDGPMRPLHRMNPVRVAWIAERLKSCGRGLGGGGRSGPTAPSPQPPPARGGGDHASTRDASYLDASNLDTSNLDASTLGTSTLDTSTLDASDLDTSTLAASILDVGCGAGVAAEAFARLGFDVLGLDAAGEAIAAARHHAAGQNLPLAYRAGAAEDLMAEAARFPVITALEVIEHVPDPAAFVATLAALLSPGGRLFLSTLNRTPRSFLAAKVGAEYLLRWLPVGTHDWRRFVTPGELAGMLRDVGLRVADITGLVVDPLTGRWATSRDLSVNYLIVAVS